MTRVVYKYQVKPSSYDTLDLPSPSKIVHFGRQGITFQVWVEHPVNADGTVPRDNIQEVDLAIFGTGHPISEGFEHVMSTIDGAYVWHLYRRTTSG